MKKCPLLLVCLFSFLATLSCQVPYDTTIVLQQYTILFNSGKWDISALDSNVVDSLGKLSHSNPRAYFEIEAHTDNIGAEAYNMALSKKRMEAVRTILLKTNIDSNAIKFDYHGEDIPIISNENENGRQQNRRAIIKWQQDYPLMPMKGRIVDAENEKGLVATIELQSNLLNYTLFSDSNGQYQLLVPMDMPIDLDIYAQDYFLETKKFRVSADKKKPDLNIELPKASIGKQFIMERLHFVGNKSILLEHAKLELPRIIKFMQKNDQICIEIAGHINRPNRPKTQPQSWDHELSIARALEIHDMLTNQNIHPDRLLAKGYGNWEMLYPTATTEFHQAKNRRVEIRIAECSHTKNTPNDKVRDRDEFY